MSIYSILVGAHGAVGLLALVTFWAAAFLRKGSALHRRIGQAYLLAMTGIIATAVPMAVVIQRSGRTVVAAFLAYLVVITAAGVWGQWRAIRDKHDVVRYTGPVYVALGVLSLLTGLGVLWLGIERGQPLLMGFSVVGAAIGIERLYKRQRRAKLAARPRWWIAEHYNAVIGNGIATHIAFLGIGLPRLLPFIDGVALHYAAWFGPLGLAAIAKVLLDRRWQPKPQPRPVVADTAPTPG